MANGMEPGLLAGLHEFPTLSNVSAASASKPADIPSTFFPTLVMPSVEPYSPKSNSYSSDALRVTKIKPAGDVIHVFSHIKKTYRVQWIVLEGGGPDPPVLNRAILSAGKTTRTQKKRKRKSEEDTGDNDEDKLLVFAKWIPLGKVTDAKYAVPIVFYIT